MRRETSWLPRSTKPAIAEALLAAPSPGEIPAVVRGSVRVRA
jgi:hypothetical protein